ncbi:MAG: hypothetical protein FJX74_00245 [Armatimonadetes bacterium]|nr:hypothetical protein [Armatimonadota bacterium]
MAHNIADGIRQLRRAASMRVLYPAGHPIHASALEHARESVGVLLGEAERADLVIAGGRMALGDTAVLDEDGVVGELAARWWDLGLCGLSISRGAEDDELDLLMTISVPSVGDLDSRAIRGRLDEIGAVHVGIVELDYDRFVPRSHVPRELQEQLSRTDIRETLRELVEGSHAEVALDGEQRGALASLLDYPDALAQAIELGVLSGPISAPATALGREPSAAEAEAAIDHAPDPAAALGRQLAATVQRLAQIGVEMAPEDREAVCCKLADALRHLEPTAVAAAFRAACSVPDADFDALAEIAKCMSVEELVEIVRARPQAVASEPSAVYRRLLGRLSAGGERLGELAPALRQALLADGVPEDVYASTIGMAVVELSEEAAEAGRAITLAVPVALNRATDAERAVRRAEIEDRLTRVFGDEAWASRAMLSLELLLTAQGAVALGAAAAGTRIALQRVPRDLREQVWQHIVLTLADVVDPRLTAETERRMAARGVIAQTAAPHRVGALLRAFETESPDTRRRIAQVLAGMGADGLAGATSLLTRRPETLSDEDVAAIVQVLVYAELEGLGGGAYVARTLTNPSCRAKVRVLRALMSEGGRMGRKWLLDAVRYGDPQLRWDIIKAAGQDPSHYIEVLEAALEDADAAVACAAADYLGASGDQRVGAVLVARVRPFDRRDPRPDFRVAVVKALGRLRYAEATEALGVVLRRKTFWRRGRNDALRAAAAEALVSIGTHEARQTVAAYASRERCDSIRQLARRVVEDALPVVTERGTTDAA